MSMNDDSASRRARRTEQGDRRNPVRPDRDDGWAPSSSARDRVAPDPYQEPRGRETPQPQRANFSNYSRAAYSGQPEPVLPQPQSQDYYQQQPPRKEPTRRVEPPLGSYSPPPPPYEMDAPHNGFRDSGRDDLFARDTDTSAFGKDAYGSQGGGYHKDLYETPSKPQPAPVSPRQRDESEYYSRETPPHFDDFDDGFQPSRSAGDSQGARFFLTDNETPPQPQKPRASAQPDRAYSPAPVAPQQQQYAPDAYQPRDHQDQYDAPFDDHWDDETQIPHEDERHDAHQQLVSHETELDEDFFADEDELENDQPPAPKRSRRLMILAALAGAIAVGGGGAYTYKALSGRSQGDENATPFIRADNRPLKELPGNPGGKQFPNGEKTIYDRLTPDGQQIQATAYAPPPAAPAETQPSGGNSLEDRIDAALKKAQQASDAPQQPAASQATPSPDQPTVVRSESYRPDGTRVDGGRQAGFGAGNSGQLPAPFGTATQAPAPVATPFQTAPVASAPQYAAASPGTRSLTPAEPGAAPAGGFWVSLKSAPDEKAIQRDLGILTDKYKSVLGEVPLTSKIADLGVRGVTYRAVAGPLNSRQEALELCQKIKGVGGDKACFVTN